VDNDELLIAGKPIQNVSAIVHRPCPQHAAISQGPKRKFDLPISSLGRFRYGQKFPIHTVALAEVFWPAERRPSRDSDPLTLIILHSEDHGICRATPRSKRET
jgi:hypothetical protein